MSETLSVTDRTRVRRKPARGSYDRAVVHAILDEALVCHVAFASEHGPVVLPTTFVRVDDQIYIHGSPANHLLRTIGANAEACVAVTLVDALVLARTAFHHSMNYRSVVLFGRGATVEAHDVKARVLAALVEKLEPGRSAACRLPNPTELSATLVVAFPIAEASAKIRTGPPIADTPEDALLPHWSGIVPLRVVRGEPIAD
jgi:nitroimidazol reductase NimA-like FMN-containing flavoprotein (pyridoxamine 5'-phosphate oxidase superfamily)